MRDAWRILHRAALALALAGMPLAAQFERSQTPVTSKEQEAIDYNRRLATPRKPAPRPKLSREEAERTRAYDRAKDSVVYIHTIKRGFWENQRGDVLAIPPATGTGFVWDNLGHVVTNHHVITYEDPDQTTRGEADDLQVTLADGKVYKAVVIGRSLTQDIAVLHVFAPLEDLKPLPIGTSHDLQVGQDVLAIGNPYGLDHTLTSGIISGLGRDIAPSDFTRITGAIQTDAAINPGNSGGPLLDRAGRLVGMNTAITSTSGSSSGVGFAIPVDTLNKVVPLLIAKGQTFRPVLGFGTMKASDTALLGITKGIVVMEVDPGSVADRAGLRPLKVRAGATVRRPEDIILGDLITGVNGHPLDSSSQLMDFLELTPPDQVLVFDILRNGKPAKITMHPTDGAKTPDSHT
jgi:S1-C subfamily serine protease